MGGIVRALSFWLLAGAFAGLIVPLRGRRGRGRHSADAPTTCDICGEWFDAAALYPHAGQTACAECIGVVGP